MTQQAGNEAHLLQFSEQGRPEDDAASVGRSPLGEKRRERALTMAVAEIARGDIAFTKELARALLRTAAQGDTRSAKRASALIGHMPRSHVELQAEYPVRFDGLRDILADRFRGRIDWMFLGADFALAIEVKTRRQTGCSQGQLAKYHRALRQLDRPYSGVLALTPIPPFKDELLAQRKRGYAGSILWSDVGPQLRQLRPRSHTTDEQWVAVLNEVLSS